MKRLLPLLYVWAGVMAFLILAAVLHSEIVNRRANFTFARLHYAGRDGEHTLKAWDTDYPAMDENLANMLERVTRITAATATVKPSDKALFDYPLVYVVEPEQVVLSDQDTKQLREYIRRGGVLLLDDFHGDEDWIPTMEWLDKIVDENQRPYKLPLTHDLFHDFYDINEVVQVVNDGIAECAADGCQQWENGPTGEESGIYAILDEFGNPSVIMAFNEDLGDGLEQINLPGYPLPMSIFATKFLANTVLFVMTH